MNNRGPRFGNYTQGVRLPGKKQSCEKEKRKNIRKGKIWGREILSPSLSLSLCSVSCLCVSSLLSLLSVFLLCSLSLSPIPMCFTREYKLKSLETGCYKKIHLLEAPSSMFMPKWGTFQSVRCVRSDLCEGCGVLDCIDLRICKARTWQLF